MNTQHLSLSLFVLLSAFFYISIDSASIASEETEANQQNILDYITETEQTTTQSTSNELTERPDTLKAESDEMLTDANEIRLERRSHPSRLNGRPLPPQWKRAILSQLKQMKLESNGKWPVRLPNRPYGRAGQNYLRLNRGPTMEFVSAVARDITQTRARGSPLRWG